MGNRGVFISLEGIEGVGKSTAVQFLSDQLHLRGIDFVINREPGGTEISEAVRQVLLGHYTEKMCSDTELLLMFACRAQNIVQCIEPALAAGRWVISDRFTDASFAYQGYGRGISRARIAALAQWVHGDLQPDITFLLDAPAAIGFERLKGRRMKDRIESERLEFFEQVRAGYLELAAQFPDRFRLIHADRPLPEVQQHLQDALDHIAGRAGKN